jgi:transcriptional regulator with XRE-family HTH domain
MSKLKSIRELQNLTQEEVAERSGISVRTIQRIETGKDPKGHTLRILAKTLAVTEKELLTPAIAETKEDNINELPKVDYTKLKLINLSTILFILLPPLNIIVPLLLMFALKQKNVLVKQLISVQILWTIIAPIVFILGIFLKLGHQFTIILIAAIVLSNVFIILRNAMELDRKKQLYFKLKFNLI